MKRLFLLGGLTLLSLQPSAGEESPPRAREPEVRSHAPLGGRRGSAFDVTLRGSSMEGAYAVWFECGDLRATVTRVEAAPREPADNPPATAKPHTPTSKKDPEYIATLRVEAPLEAVTGLHAFRLITPRGASNARLLQVVSDPVLEEQSAPHGTTATAQPIVVPIVVNGSVGKKGEIDFYAFDVAAGAALRFEVLPEFKIDVPYRAQAELGLWERTGSWFDPERAVPLPLQKPVLAWEPINRYRRHDFAAEFVLFPSLTHRFERAGRFYLSVAAFLGRGGPDFPYELRITTAPADDPRGSHSQALGAPAHPEWADWLERDSATMRQFGSFPRRLEAERLEQLWKRSVRVDRSRDGEAHPESVATSGATDPGTASPGSPASTRPATGPLATRHETEPNENCPQAMEVSLPVILEGAIDRPGDIDVFKLHAAAGERVALEVETPAAHPPRWNPWLKVLDSDGRELVTNIFKEYGGDGDDVNKTVERKTTYKFDRAGDYYVQIRNLIAREGEPAFLYRLLLRPQVPHLGRIELSLGVSSKGSQVNDLTDRMNLPRGEARKLTLLCEKEEGFDGDVAITADNLPPGVDVLPSSPASWTEILLRGMQYRPLGVELVSPEHHRPHREVVTLLVSARADAPVSRVPQPIRFTAWPVVAGRRGTGVPAGEAVVMVVEAK